MNYSFDLQKEIYAILDNQKFPYEKIPIDKTNVATDIAIYKLFVHHFIDDEILSNKVSNNLYSYYVGVYYHIQQNYKEACNHLSTLFIVGCFHRDYCDKIWFLLGNCYEKLQDYKNMEECYVYGIQLNKHSYITNALITLATYYKIIEKNEKNEKEQEKYLLLLLENAQKCQSKKALEFLESELLCTTLYHPCVYFDFELLIKIEKEFIRLEVVRARNTTTSTST